MESDTDESDHISTDSNDLEITPDVSAKSADTEKYTERNAAQFRYLNIEKDLGGGSRVAFLVCAPIRLEEKYNGEEGIADYVPVIFADSLEGRLIRVEKAYRKQQLGDAIKTRIESHEEAAGTPILLKTEDYENGTGLSIESSDAELELDVRAELLSTHVNDPNYEEVTEPDPEMEKIKDEREDWEPDKTEEH